MIEWIAVCLADNRIRHQEKSPTQEPLLLKTTTTDTSSTRMGTFFKRDVLNQNLTLNIIDFKHQEPDLRLNSSEKS